MIYEFRLCHDPPQLLFTVVDVVGVPWPIVVIVFRTIVQDTLIDA